MVNEVDCWWEEGMERWVFDGLIFYLNVEINAENNTEWGEVMEYFFLLFFFVFIGLFFKLCSSGRSIFANEKPAKPRRKCTRATYSMPKTDPVQLNILDRGSTKPGYPRNCTQVTS